MPTLFALKILTAATAVLAALPPGREITLFTRTSSPGFGSLSTNRIVSQFIAPHTRIFGILTGYDALQQPCKVIAHTVVESEQDFDDLSHYIAVTLIFYCNSRLSFLLLFSSDRIDLVAS